MIWGQLLGAGISLLGSKKAADSADAANALKAQQMKALSQVNFNPWNIEGPGGMGLQFGQNGFAGMNLGGNQGIWDLFSQLGEQNIMGGQNIQSQANQGLGALQNMFGGAAGLAGDALGQAGALGSGGFQRGLQDQLFGQAGALAGQTDFSSLRDQTLNTLREQAAPFEQRAFSNLQDNQFATGRLGSSGGALQTEAFARGLGQADLSRQLQATGVAQQQQMQNANIANMFGGLGQNIRGLEDNLLNNAFSRFGQTSGLAADLNNQMFNRGGAMWNQAIAGLGAQSGLLQNLLGMGQMGLDAGRLDAQTALGAAGGAGNMAASMGPTGGDLWGGLMSSLGGNMLQSGGGMEGLWAGLKGLFSNPSTGSGGR